MITLTFGGESSSGGLIKRTRGSLLGKGSTVTPLNTIGTFFRLFSGYSGIGVKLSSRLGDFWNQSVPITLVGVCLLSSFLAPPILLVLTRG